MISHLPQSKSLSQHTWFIFIIFALFGLWSSSLFSQTIPAEFNMIADEAVNISADKVSYDTQDELLVLSGQVRIIQQPWIIEADTITVNVREQTALGRGNVSITRKDSQDQVLEVLRAREVQIDLTSESGWMIEARVHAPWEDGLVTLHGKKLERISEKTYLMHTGGVTLCRCSQDQTPDWEIVADSATATIEDTVKLKDARVLIRGRTIAYVPALTYPIGTERRSGFLMPEIDMGSLDGFELTIPYYQVLGPSADATLYPHIIADRGFMLGSEFRYNTGTQAQGQDRAQVIYDYKEQAWRYGAALDHSTSIGNLDLKARLRLISDNEYVLDFDKDIAERWDRQLESRMVAAYHNPDWNISAELSWFDDLAGGQLRDSEQGRDHDADMIQRLPAIKATLLTREIFDPLYMDVSLAAANHWREQGPSGGQMLDLYPRLVLPVRLGPIQLWSAAGAHGLLYAPDPKSYDAPSIGLQPEALARASFTMAKVYQGTGSRRYRHTIEPTLIGLYRGDPHIDSGEFYEQADPREQVGMIGINLESRLFSKPSDPQANGRTKETSRVEITQMYDALDKEFRDIRLEAALSGPGPWRLKLDSYYGWYVNEITGSRVKLAYRDSRENDYWVGYNRDSGQINSPLFDIAIRPAEDLSAGLGLNITDRVNLKYSGNYSIMHQRFVKQKLIIDYTARQECWAATLTVSDRIRPDQTDAPHDISANLALRLSGM